jgi:DNA-binding NtrC family response regulator
MTELFGFVLVRQGSQAFEGRKLLDHATQLDRHQATLVATRCIDMGCFLEYTQMAAVHYTGKPVPPAEVLRFVQGCMQVDRLSLQGSAV